MRDPMSDVGNPMSDLGDPTSDLVEATGSAVDHKEISAAALSALFTMLQVLASEQ